MGKKKRAEDIIKETIEGMEPEQRRVVVGYFFNHLSVLELSKALKLSPSEVYALTREGRELLREKIRLVTPDDKKTDDRLYLCAEIFFSCAEEAVEIGERL